MRQIEMFEHVRLKDGREGAVVEIFGDSEAFLIDIGRSPSDWDTVYVTRAEIIDPS